VTKTLPLPLQFELPGPEWRPVAPESVGVENAAFLAVREPAGPTSYRPTLTISGDWRTDDASIDQIADESVVKVQEEAGNARLIQRTSVGSDEAPAATQLISARATIQGVDYDLRQVQAVAGYLDLDDPSRRIVVIYTLSCTADQLELAGREFQAFMATVRVVTDEEAGEQS
jgi:hypothetical protein